MACPHLHTLQQVFSAPVTFLGTSDKVKRADATFHLSGKKVALNASAAANSRRWLKQCTAVIQGASYFKRAAKPVYFPMFTLAPSILVAANFVSKFVIPNRVKASFNVFIKPAASSFPAVSTHKQLACSTTIFSQI